MCLKAFFHLPHCWSGLKVVESRDNGDCWSMGCEKNIRFASNQRCWFANRYAAPEGIFVILFQAKRHR
jgi:hypothetical protein